MNKRQGRYIAFFMLGTASLFFFSSCRKTVDVIDPTATIPSSSTATGPVTNSEVDNWILANMRQFYYWNDKIPASPDTTLAPSDFFKSILNTYNATGNPNGDRFSVIRQSATELVAALNGETKTDGLEYKLYLRSANSDAVIGKVLYIQKDSPAAQAGLVRGDIFYQINGQNLNTSNYSGLLSGDVKTYTLAKVDGSTIVNTTTTKQTTAVVYRADPVYLDSIYTIKGRTIGYLVYNQFVNGPTGTSDHTYDNEVDRVFATFKTQGVTDLVLDLRYNPGGYVTAAQNLASLIAKGVDGTKIFYRKEYNSTLTPVYQAKYGASFFNGYFLDKASNIGGNLRTLTVLTTNKTASASELIINGLKPFMDVSLIGATTVGKNVGSITVSDPAGRIKWGLQPIVTKSFNAVNQSDYSTGFKPNQEVTEYTNEVWKPLGDVNESLLKAAIVRITASARLASRASEPTYEIGSSIEQKAGGSNMFFTDTSVSH